LKSEIVRSPHLLLPLLLVLLEGAPSLASSEDPKTLVIQGRTMDHEGFPVAKVRMRVEGDVRMSTLSNTDGKYSLSVPIGSPSELRRAPRRIAVVAERRGWRFSTPGGDGRLALEIGIELADGAARCVARSNETRLAASAARAVAVDGKAAAVAEVNFLGTLGPGFTGEAWPRLEHVAKSSLAFPLTGPAKTRLVEESPAPTTEPAKPRNTRSIFRESPTKPSRKTQPEARHGDGNRREARGTRDTIESTPAPRSLPAPLPSPPVAGARGDEPPTPSPSPAISPPSARERGSGPRIFPPPPAFAGRSRPGPLVIRADAPRPKADSCECRVEGTIEVEEVVPLSRPQRIELWLNWYPQLRDTVDLFMGPPRRFEIPVAPCGPQRLRLRVLTEARLEVATREAMAGFRCNGDSVIQRRILLVTR
jgi:hypothetical protein